MSDLPFLGIPSGIFLHYKALHGDCIDDGGHVVFFIGYEARHFYDLRFHPHACRLFPRIYQWPDRLFEIWLRKRSRDGFCLSRIHIRAKDLPDGHSFIHSFIRFHSSLSKWSPSFPFPPLRSPYIKIFTYLFFLSFLLFFLSVVCGGWITQVVTHTRTRTYVYDPAYLPGCMSAC